MIFNPSHASGSGAAVRARYGLYDSAAEQFGIDYDAVDVRRLRPGGAALGMAHDMAVLPAFIPAEKPCFSVRSYKSGELSGAYFVAGLASKVKPPTRTGPVLTSCFTVKAKSKIRRAVENTSSDLVTFLTLTFSPWDAMPWQISNYCPRLSGVSSKGSVKVCRSVSRFGKVQRFLVVPRVSLKHRKGFVSRKDKKKIFSINVVVPVVRQDYAKYRLKNLRMALTQKVNRQMACKLAPQLLPLGDSSFIGPLPFPLVGPPVHHFAVPWCDQAAYRFKTSFRMIWVAELQANGNIHFHALTNKFFAKMYIAKLWPFGRTQIKKLNDAEHAAHYMVKYMSKDNECIIEGNRYNISQTLRKEAKPVIYGMEGKDACEARKSLMLMKELVEAKGGRVIDSGFGFNMPKPRRTRKYKEKETGLIKQTQAVKRSCLIGFLSWKLSGILALSRFNLSLLPCQKRKKQNDKPQICC